MLQDEQMKCCAYHFSFSAALFCELLFFNLGGPYFWGCLYLTGKSVVDYGAFEVKLQWELHVLRQC